jgi:hypothetical protein
VIYFLNAGPVLSSSLSTRAFLCGYALRNWCSSVIPSLCIAPVFSLEIWLMIVVSCSSGSGSLVGGAVSGPPCPLAELEVRAGDPECRLKDVEDSVRGGDMGRLSRAEDALVSAPPGPFEEPPSAPTRVLELRIRYTYGYTIVAEGSSNEDDSISYTSSP